MPEENENPILQYGIDAIQEPIDDVLQNPADEVLRYGGGASKGKPKGETKYIPSTSILTNANWKNLNDVADSITALGEAAHFKSFPKYEVELDDKGRVVSSTVTVPTTKKLPVLPANMKLTPAEKKSGIDLTRN